MCPIDQLYLDMNQWKLEVISNLNRRIGDKTYLPLLKSFHRQLIHQKSQIKQHLLLTQPDRAHQLLYELSNVKRHTQRWIGRMSEPYPSVQVTALSLVSLIELVAAKRLVTHPNRLYDDPIMRKRRINDNGQNGTSLAAYALAKMWFKQFPEIFPPLPESVTSQIEPYISIEDYVRDFNKNKLVPASLVVEPEMEQILKNLFEG